MLRPIVQKNRKARPYIFHIKQDTTLALQRDNIPHHEAMPWGFDPLRIVFEAIQPVGDQPEWDFGFNSEDSVLQHEVRTDRGEERSSGADGRVDGGSEWTSRIIPRYHRRMAEVNEAIVATYLVGGNTRRIRGALQPLLKAAPLSRSAVSRVISTLKDGPAAWRTRSLSTLDVI